MSIYDLKGRDMLCLCNFTAEEIWHMIRHALELKRRYYAGERVIPVLAGASVALIFQKPSTRTRVSLEVAVNQLGGHPLYLGWRDLQLGRGETIHDTAKVLSRYVDGIVARVFDHGDLEELAEYSDVPVINALSDFSHPTQVLADMMTIYEKLGRLRGVTLAFVGDGRDNVLNSLLFASAILGVNVRVASPRELWPEKSVMDIVDSLALESGAEIMVTEDPVEAVRGADVVYTDVWVSMGQEDIADKKRELLRSYQVNRDLMAHAKETAIFMHCLPAKRGEEVTDEVMDGSQSAVWDQAENRLHANKAILSLLL